MAAARPRGRDVFRLIDDPAERNAQLDMTILDWLANEVYDAEQSDVHTMHCVVPKISISRTDPAARVALGQKVSDLLLPADFKRGNDAASTPAWKDVAKQVEWVVENLGPGGVVAKAFRATKSAAELNAIDRPSPEEENCGSHLVDFTYIWEVGTLNRLHSAIQALFGRDLANLVEEAAFAPLPLPPNGSGGGKKASKKKKSKSSSPDNQPVDAGPAAAQAAVALARAVVAAAQQAVDTVATRQEKAAAAAGAWTLPPSSAYHTQKEGRSIDARAPDPPGAHWRLLWGSRDAFVAQIRRSLEAPSTSNDQAPPKQWPRGDGSQG